MEVEAWACAGEVGGIETSAASLEEEVGSKVGLEVAVDPMAVEGQMKQQLQQEMVVVVALFLED